MTTTLNFSKATTFFDNSYLRTLIKNFGTKGYTCYNSDAYDKASSKKGIWRLVEKVNAFFQKIIHRVHAFFSSAYKNQFCYVAKVVYDQKNPSEENLEQLEKKLMKASRIQALHSSLRSIWADKEGQEKLKELGIDDLCISDEFVEVEKKILAKMQDKLDQKEIEVKEAALAPPPSEVFFKELESVDSVFKEMFSIYFQKFNDNIIKSWKKNVLTLTKSLKLWVPSDVVKGGNIFILGPEVTIKLDKGKISFDKGYNNYCNYRFTNVTSNMYSIEVKGNHVEFFAGKSKTSSLTSQKQLQLIEDVRDKWSRGEVLADDENMDTFLQKKLK